MKKRHLLRKYSHTKNPFLYRINFFFISGIFGEDIGEDYFGFKSIGLDQEYNLDSLTVIYLFFFQIFIQFILIFFSLDPK